MYKIYYLKKKHDNNNYDNEAGTPIVIKLLRINEHLKNINS